MMTTQMRQARQTRATKAKRLGRGDAAHLRRLRTALRRDPAQATTVISAPPAQDGIEEDVMVADVIAVADDPLPENAVYHDEGCEVARSCLACPLALCVFDRPGTASERRREGRDRLIRVLLARGWTAARVAQQFGLSAAQVRRIRAACG